MPLDEGMERDAIAGRRAGYEIRICRRTETAVHCQEYDVELAETVDRISPTMWFKSKTPALGDFEQLVLLGVLRLGEEAYGAAIRQEIHAKSGRDVSINAVYTTLDRLEAKGLLRSWTGEPTAQRGGRRRKFYALQPAGNEALRHAYQALQSMAAGLEGHLKTK